MTILIAVFVVALAVAAVACAALMLRDLRARIEEFDARSSSGALRDLRDQIVELDDELDKFKEHVFLHFSFRNDAETRLDGRVLACEDRLERALKRLAGTGIVDLREELIP